MTSTTVKPVTISSVVSGPSLSPRCTSSLCSHEPGCAYTVEDGGRLLIISAAKERTGLLFAAGGVTGHKCHHSSDPVQRNRSTPFGQLAHVRFFEAIGAVLPKAVERLKVLMALRG